VLAAASPEGLGDAREVPLRVGTRAGCVKPIESAGDCQHLCCLGSWKQSDFSGR